MGYTTEQVIKLAPDDASAKAGKGLASSHKWAMLGRDERALWGECKGSGSQPYQVMVDPGEPAFYCTCPSRKFPCKHALGLFLMYADRPASLLEQPAPDWVIEWLAKREARSRKAENKEAAAPRSAFAQEKRAGERLARTRAGMESLELWLADLVREGLASAPARPPSFWWDQAARLVDAQAPGTARWVRQMATLPLTGEGWQERMLERIGRLYLLAQGVRRFDSLPEETQADIRAAIGWTMRQEELLSQPGRVDRWLVTGQETTEEEGIAAQRTWLWGERGGQAALILHFAAYGQPLDASFLVGSAFEAEIVFYPGAYPLRAVIKARLSPAVPSRPVSGYPTLGAVACACGAALSKNPWLESFPAMLSGAVPLRSGDRWAIRDSQGAVAPVSPRYTQGWNLLAASGGRPIPLFGEWDGYSFYPMRYWVFEDGNEQPYATLG
ncbi:MAG: SWIM zinc finger family protein [Armatimonadetes bacterium]|nr:SWIM zinc finger family protein [Armatimonadota bacterium]